MTPLTMQQVTETAQARIAALVERDLNVLNQILDPDFVYTNAAGHVFGRREYLEQFAAPPEVIWHSQELSDVHVRLHDDVAILTAITHDRATFYGTTFDAHFRTTQVYKRVEDGCQYIAGHTSQLPEG